MLNMNESVSFRSSRKTAPKYRAYSLATFRQIPQVTKHLSEEDIFTMQRLPKTCGPAAGVRPVEFAQRRRPVIRSMQ